MRATEFISEHKTTEYDRETKNAEKGAYIARDVGGYDRVYHMNRLMMAMAKADGKNTGPVDSPADTWFEKYNTLHPYTQEEDNMIKAGMATIPTDGRQIAPFSKSKESDDTHRSSPVPHNSGKKITRNASK
jgi:hypothetical protein